MIKAIIFDLDGTLVDTLADIAGMMNMLLSERGLPTHSLEDYRYMVGRGFASLLRSALPPDSSVDLDRFEMDAFARYKVMGSGSSRPYPGVVDALATLASGGIKLGVLSNKPDPMTADMIATLFPGTRFGFVRGGLPGVPLKPDPTTALEAATALGAPPSECAFVGDSDVDMRTAVNAGMLAVGAAWGFRTEDELKAAGAAVIAQSMADVTALASDSSR